MGQAGGGVQVHGLPERGRRPWRRKNMLCLYCPGTEAATARLGEAAGARAMAPCVGTGFKPGQRDRALPVHEATKHLRASGARFQYRLRKRVIACSGSTVGTASSASRDERCMPSVGRTTRVRIGGRGLTLSASPGASPPVTLARVLSPASPGADVSRGARRRESNPFSRPPLSPRDSTQTPLGAFPPVAAAGSSLWLPKA